jgi:hypothetical protein
VNLSNQDDENSKDYVMEKLLLQKRSMSKSANTSLEILLEKIIDKLRTNF